MKIERECSHCKNMFEPRRTDQKYCSDKCKVAAWKVRTTALGNTPQATTTPSPSVKMNSLVSPEALPVSAKFIIDELTRQRDKYEKLVDDHEATIKKLRDELLAMEKERDKALNELEAKPSGLSGFLSNPENVKETVSQIPTVLAGIAEVIKSMKSEQAQTAAELPPAKEHDLIVWLKGQPVNIQHGFLDIVRGLISAPHRAEEFISYFKRSMANAGIEFNNAKTA